MAKGRLALATDLRVGQVVRNLNMTRRRSAAQDTGTVATDTAVDTATAPTRPPPAATGFAHQVVAAPQVVDHPDDVDQGGGGHVEAEGLVAELSGQVRDGEEPRHGSHRVGQGHHGEVLADHRPVGAAGGQGFDDVT